MKTTRGTFPAPLNARVEAVILTRDDPVRLNACLWSLALQVPYRPASILIVNTGAWCAGEVGGSIDIISEMVPVRMRRLRNGKLGDVHRYALNMVEPGARVWFFQDDAVASSNCLEGLLATRARFAPNDALNTGAVVPTIMYPDYRPLPGEAAEQPQEVTNAFDSHDRHWTVATRGPCLGILMDWDVACHVSGALDGLPMGIDDVICRVARPVVAASGIVYHTRPERPRWDRIVDLMKTKVLPGVKA